MTSLRDLSALDARTCAQISVWVVQVFLAVLSQMISSGGFPDEWKDVALLANPITSKINAVKIVKRNPDGTIYSRASWRISLISKDDWFRPVNVRVRPRWLSLHCRLV